MFEIGDKVIYGGADPKAYKRRGVVKSIEDKNGKPQLTVELENGEVFTAPIDDWSREFTNARACNSSNPIVQKALNAMAKNAQHFHGDLDAKAETIVQLYNKLTGDKIKDKVIKDKITVILRGLSSLGTKAWIMRDGSVAITPEQPRGAKPFVELLNSETPKPLNACAAKNAIEDDPEALRKLNAFWTKIAAIKREAVELDKYLVRRKHYGYSAKLEYIARALDD